MMTGQALMLAVAPFVGLALAPNKALATLPIGVQLGTTLLATMPAAFIMKHRGRRFGFVMAAILGIIGSAIAAYAIAIGNLWLFCGGLALNGLHNSFGTYYRFAAADAASPAYKSRAISYVMAGGVIAAFIGPNLANWTANLIPGVAFTGSYLGLIAVYMVSLVAILSVDIPPPTEEERRTGGRPFRDIAAQPAFLVAVLGAMIGYGVMSLIMTSTPLAMHEHHYPFGDAAFIIQWHMLGMFAPSFVTGRLIARYGVLTVMQWGAALCVLAVGVNLSSTTLPAIWVALVALGIGWNFLFVAATALLTETYKPEEKAKAQSMNDFLVLGTVTATAFLSGPLHYGLGWEVLNVSVVPLIALIAIAVLWLKRRRAVAVTPAT